MCILSLCFTLIHVQKRDIYVFTEALRDVFNQPALHSLLAGVLTLILCYLIGVQLNFAFC